MKRDTSAFTLVEMLAVIAIMAILFVLVAPAAKSIAGGTQLSQATDAITGSLIQARQTALAKGRLVEVRFYKTGASDVPGEQNANRFRSFQIFEIDDAGKPVPVGKVQKLPPSIIIDSGSTVTSIADAALAKTWSASDPQISLPSVGTNYTAQAFRFRRDGSTSLDPLKLWFLTLHDLNKGDGLATPPPNYATLQIEPINGEIRTFRP